MNHCFIKKQKQPSSFLKLSLVLAFALTTPLGYSQTVDCSASANCADAYCSFAANVERGCNCFDNIDNDGDGKIDKADSNCATYYGLSFVGEGSDCSIVPPGSSDPFDLVGAPISTSQNTADTQSKVSVGDVDGDGIPDAVITSKYNREIRVVATTDNQADGKDAGDIKSDYKTTGQGGNIFSGTGVCSPDKIMWEHENAIADIDGNGIGEIFAIASNRGNATGSPPTCFWLVAFTYTRDDLTPMYNAVEIGTDRPGAIGVADMDGDGKAEIYLRDRIYAAETGKLLAYGNGNWDLDITSGPAAVNISGDTKMELVCGTKIFSIPSLTNRAPATPALMTPIHDMNTVVPGVQCFVKMSNDPIEYGNDTHSMSSVADIDRDGIVDVVISGALNSTIGRTAVFYWNVAKNTVAYSLTASSADLGYGVAHAQYANYLTGWIWGTGRVNIGDANGDGKSDLSFVAGAHLYVLTTNAAGTGLQTLWTQNLTAIAGNPAGSVGYRIINDSRSGVIAVTIYDFNNDGKPSMAYRDQNDLVVVDGATGATVEWTKPCNSHTYTEGPIIADVNGDGATDICVTCSFNNFNAAGDLQNQALGQYRLYYSSGNEWLPTRKVWNQHPYFVVNINDDLTLPFPQLDQNLVFGTAPCPNGTPGPQMPLNVFMNQVPHLSANGCPVFPAPDLSFTGDDPANLPFPAGDPRNQPAVEVIPPICGDLAIQVRFRIINDGDLPITATVPVSFFKADPTLASTTAADKLYTTNINITNLPVDGTLLTAFETFNGTGGTFTLYIVLNNDGSVLPIDPNATSTTECRLDNNMYSVAITPDPFTTVARKVTDNFKCVDTAPNTGEVRARIFKGTVEQTDYSPYAFQWYSGPASNPVIINGATSYNLANIAEGTYTVRVTNTQKGCVGEFVDTVILRTGVDPNVKIDSVGQTKCNPPNGELHATVLDPGGNTGFTFAWFDVGLNALGITGPDALNLTAGNYKLIVSKAGCNKQIDAPPITSPKIPDAQASVVQHVIDCVNPNSGSITADALFSGQVQPAANYTFNWYFYDNATSTRGSILPGANGTGQTRTGLAVGYYQVEITDINTQCKANQTPIVQVTSQTVIPTAAISQLAAQTSCDPNRPNGSLSAVGTAAGYTSPTDFTFEWFRGDNTLLANKIPIAGGPETLSGTKGETLNSAKGGGIIYTVKVTTPLNCFATNKLTLTENVNVPVLTLTELTPNTVCDAALSTTPYNGSVQATVTFGVDGSNNPIPVTLPDPNYKFTWYDGTTTTTLHVPAPGDLQDPVLTGLRDGNYAATVERTDLFCVSVPNTTPVSKATVLPILSATSTGSNNCDAALTPDGTVTVSVTNTGVSPGPFTYKWYAGNAVGVNPLTTGANSQNGDQATAIKVGGPVGAPNPYTVEVLNTATGCVNNTTQFVADNSVIPVLSFASIVPNSMCDPTKFNGSLTTQVDNIPAGYTISDYTFRWYDGQTTATLHNPPSTTTLLDKLDAGFYTVDGRNTKTGCPSAPITNQVPNAKIFPALLPASTGSNNCEPLLTPDGTASYSVTNVQPGDVFTQQWYTGATVTAGNELPPANNGTSVTAIKLGGPTGAPHSYTVFVTNTTTGCTNFTTASVADVSVVPVLSTSVQPNSMCDPTKWNGSMSVAVTNIPVLYTIADYDFTWRNAANTIIQGPTAATLLSSVDVGAYSVIGVNRLTGCTSSSATNNVPDAKIYPTLTPSSTGSNNCDPSKTPDGTASIAVSGTAGPHAFQWYVGSGDPIAGAFPTVPTLGNNGQSATAINLGGPVGAPNAYSVLVTDTGTGCTNFTTAMVADISFIPVLSFGLIKPNTICSPSTLFDGEMNVQVDNLGTYTLANFSFTWYDGTTTATLHNPQPAATTDDRLTLLDVAQYTVEATNTVTGCKSNPITSQVPDGKVYPAISITTTGSHNCTTNVDADGMATATVTNNGVGDPLTFQWNAVGATAAISNAVNNANQATAIKLGGPVNAPNTYNVLVTNTRTGCFNNNQGLVADISMKPTLTLQAFDNHVCDPALISPGAQVFDGRVEITGVNYNGVAYAGTSVLTYEWFDVDVATNAITGTNAGSTTTILPNLDNDKYAATVKINDLDCTSDPVITEVLDDLTPPAITSVTSANTNCPGGAMVANGSAAVTFVDGTGVGATTDYTYQWYDGAIVDAGQIRAGDINPLLSNTIQGTETFTVEVTNRVTGCVNATPMTVTDAKVIPTIAVTLTQNNTICDIATIDPTGVLLATPANAGTNFTITWVGGVAPAVAAGTDGEQFTKLKAGAYSATVKNDDTGCESLADGQSIIDDLTYPNILITVQDQTTCAGTPNGMLTANAGAGVTYSWFDGIGTGGLPHGQTAANSGIINQLPSDDYTVEAEIDATGCTAIESEFVPNNITYPTISFAAINPVTSCTSPNGSATVTIAGLSAPTKYDIFYVFTSTLSGAAYPTDPAVIKASTDPANGTDEALMPVAYGNLIPGYITSLVIDKNTLCESTPATQQILDNTVKSNITLTLHASPGICGSGFGGIDPTVGPLAAAAYTYEWYAGSPTNGPPINFFNNPPAFSTGQIYGDNGPNLGINHSPVDNTISPGTFTLVVRDPDGCGTYKTDNVPTSTVPVIGITPTQITRCDVSNGQLSVQVTSGTSIIGYSLEVFSGNDNTGASLGTIGFSPINTVLTVSNLPEGPYFVELIDGDNPTCPLGDGETLLKDVLPPILTVDQIIPNTSCDPSTAADGKIDITVTNANGDTQPKSYHIFNINPLPVGFTLNPAPGNIIGTGASGQTTGLINGFEPAATVPSYTITVKDDLSKCEADLVVTIPDQQSLPSDLNIGITPETACEPLSNGSALASLSGGEVTTIFDFDWYKNNDATGSVTGTVAGNGAGTAGELLNQGKVLAPADWTMGTTGQGAGNRTYYVQGVKNAAAPSGIGCKTALIQVVIPDEHVSPDMSLTAAFNSFCNATAGGTPGDGSIAIVADADPSVAGDQNAAAGFRYAWTNANVATASPQNDDQTFTIPQLGTGTYQVTATNRTNQCVVTNSVDIDPAPFVITITNRTVIDQRICDNDGAITVTRIDLTDQGAGLPGSSEDHQNAAIDPLYDFQWYTNAALTPGTELRDGPGGAGALITPRTLSNDADQDLTFNEAGDYQAMQAGTYYVVATRRTTAPLAAGCPSLPFRVDVQDVHINPVPQLTALSNTSCLPAGPGEGEIIINVADATTAPFAGGTYTYTWIAPGPMPANPPVTNLNPGAGNGDGIGADDHYTQLMDNATLGNPNPYTIAIENINTGCVVNASATIIKNATPVFVQEVTVTDEILCSTTGDGSITVTKVSLNDRTGASQDFTTTTVPAISQFNFEWTRGAIAFTQTTPGTTLDKTTYNAAPTPGGFGTPIGAGTYTVTARRATGTPGAGCPSAPFQVTIQNKQIFPVAVLTPFANTACSPAAADMEGEITIEVTDTSPAVGAAGFTYIWDGTNPTPIAAANPGTSDGDGLGGGDTDGLGTDNDEDHPRTLQEGDYKVTVTSNKSGCSIDATTKILKNLTPVFIQNVVAVDQVICNPDGSLTVARVTLNDRNGNTQTFNTSTTPNISDFAFTWQRADGAGTQTTAGTVLNAANYVPGNFAGSPAFGADTYTVVATRTNGGPGAGCPSAPFSVSILDRRIFPVVTLTPFANTSCDPNFFEGEIRVEVTDASVNLPAPLTGAPFVYNYNWTTSATPAVINGAVAGTHDGDGFGGGETDATPAVDNDADHPTGLLHGAYAIQVTNTQTNCPATASTTIFKNSTPVFTQLVTPTDQVLCSADGRLVVNEVRVIDKSGATQSSLTDFPIGDFEFTYSRTTPGNTVPGGITGTQLNNVNYPAIGADTYYVVATRRTGAPGKDCSSPPYKVDILNKQLFPVVSLTPLANTSCDPTFFEGEIKVKVTDNSVNIPAPLPGTPFVYSYNWTASATPGIINGAVAGTHDGDGFGGGEMDATPAVDNDADHPRGLMEGSYTIQVTNTQTSCPSLGSTTIFRNSTPVFTQLVVPTDQVICNPDGSLLVQEVKVIDRDGNEQSNLAGDFALSDFVFSYDRGTIGNTVVNNTHPAQPVIQLNNTNYGAIGFDSYYVVATRTAGGPGLNCSSAPYKVDIEDKRLFPKVAFSSVANSSCSDLKPNGSVTASASEQNGSTANPYTFTWTLDGGALAPTSTQTDNTPTSVVGNALDGTYVVTATNSVTGCPFDASFILELDQTQSTPNIIDVTTIDPLDCNPTAQAEVTKITLGSQTNSSLFPPNVPPNNEITGADLLNFNYNWFQEGIAPTDQLPKTGPPYVTTPCIGPGCATPSQGLVPGTYYVFVLDPTTDCQSGPKEVVINDDDIVYPNLVITQTEVQVSCVAGIGTAALQALADGQNDTNPNYSFSWFRNLTTTAPSFTTASTATNLVAGDYSVSVTDATTGCSATDLYIVPEDAPRFLPVISLSTEPRINCVNPDGTLLSREVGYNPDSGYPFAPNYSSELYIGANANVTQPGTVMTNIPGFNRNWLENGLDVGFYTVKITDNNTGCITTSEVELKDGRTPPVVVIIQENPLTNCDPLRPNGQLFATADNNRVGGYSFEWYSGNAVSGGAISDENMLIAQTTGFYNVRVTNDFTGCFDDETGEIQDGTVPAPVPTPEVVFHRTHCVDPDGWVTATVGGIIANYDFFWFDDNTDAGNPDFNGVDYTERSEGPYTVKVMDVTTGCFSPPATIEVLDKTVIPILTFETTPSFCEDLPDSNSGNGSIQAIIDPGNVSVASLVWTNAATNVVVGETTYIYGLYPGFYNADLITTKGCPANGTAEVKTEIMAYNLVTRNNDAKNDMFVIDCIGRFPNNNVKIFNRSGVKVYEADGYNNSDVVFIGIGEKGLYTTGTELPVGTYFFVINKGDGSKPRTGYMELVK